MQKYKYNSSKQLKLTKSKLQNYNKTIQNNNERFTYIQVKDLVVQS